MGGARVTSASEKAIEMGKAHLQQKVLVIDDVDRQVWELVSNVPHVNKPVAVVSGLFNFLFPGVGTWIAACAADTVSKTQLAIGLLQLLTAVILIGWFWALYWAYLIGRKAFSEARTTNAGPARGGAGQF